MPPGLQDYPRIERRAAPFSPSRCALRDGAPSHAYDLVGEVLEGALGGAVKDFEKKFRAGQDKKA